MRKLENCGMQELAPQELRTIEGGLPILVVLGAITTAVSVGRILDQAGEWFLQGWNNPR
jgi:hypothetical protein